MRDSLVQCVVTLPKSEHPGWWPAGYWLGLVGCGLRMPAGVVDGRTIEGVLVAADEGADEITLTFADVGPESPGS